MSSAIETDKKTGESAEITVASVASKARWLDDNRLSNATPAQLRAVNALLEEANRILRLTSIAPHKMCKLDVQELALGILQVTFIIPKGMSGKMVLDAIEKDNPRSPGEGVVWPQSSLLNDAGLSDIVTKDTKFSTTICFDSNNLTRREQASYLKDRGLDFTDRWILTVAAALYRDEQGFPSDRNDIGTSRDKGDLFKGNIVRAGSGAPFSTQFGLRDDGSYDVNRRALVVAAGSAPSNQKI